MDCQNGCFGEAYTLIKWYAQDCTCAVIYTDNIITKILNKCELHQSVKEGQSVTDAECFVYNRLINSQRPPPEPTTEDIILRLDAIEALVVGEESLLDRIKHKVGL